jgi:hypothetical protein
MPILTLLGVIAVTLAGAATLAFRVVRVPGNGATRDAAPRVSANHPAAMLLNKMSAEYQRHTIALREALNLRRARNEAEAQTRLLNERVRHAVAARDLARIARPASGWLVIRLWDQAALDRYVDRVRREVATVRVPGQTRPLTREGALRRAMTWALGGPRVGFASDLVEYHRGQREHYRLAMTNARRLTRAGSASEAQTQLWNEQDFHMRSAQELGEMFGITQSGTGPLATRQLAPIAPPEPVAP